MTSAFFSRRLALLTALASTVLLAACGGGGGGDGGGSTNIRALNLTNDLASIDIFTSDTKRFSAVVTDVLAPNIAFEANTYTLNVKRAGDGATLLSGSYALGKDQNYTAIVWGRENALRLSTLPENENAAEIATGNTRLRVFNATIDTGPVDIFITPSAVDIGNSAATRANVASGALSGFSDLSAGTYRLRVTGANAPSDLRLDIPAITLKDKGYATLVLTGGASGVLVNGTIIEQQGTVTTLRNTKARVRLVAGANNAGIVSATFGSTTLFGAVRSPGITPYTTVEAGSTPTDLTVRVNGTAVLTGPRSLVAGTDYTLLAYGLDGAPAVQLLTDDNRLPTISGRSKVRLLHAAAGTDALTLSINFLAVASDVAVGSVSPFVTVESGSSTRVDVTSVSAVTPLLSESPINLVGQSIYTVFVLGGNAAPQSSIRRER